MGQLPMLRALVVAFALCLSAEAALGQLTPSMRRSLQVSPPGSASLGQAVTLSVRGAARAARYSFVAARTAAGGSSRTAGNCSTTQSLGSGATVTWHPGSGSYRLTAYGAGQAAADTLSLTYIVKPRTVMLASGQTPAQPSGVTLVLRTDDLGPGHQYEWWMQYTYVTGSGPGSQHMVPSQGWIAHTSGPLATHPTPIPASSQIRATVSIHRGDPCDIVAAGQKP